MKRIIMANAGKTMRRIDNIERDYDIVIFCLTVYFSETCNWYVETIQWGLGLRVEILHKETREKETQALKSLRRIAVESIFKVLLNIDSS